MPAYSFNWFGLYHTVQIYLYESSLFRNIYFFQFTINCPRGCKIAIQLRGNSVRPPNATCTCLMKNLSLLFLKKINTTLLHFHFRSNLLIITYVRTCTCDPLLFCVHLYILSWKTHSPSVTLRKLILRQSRQNLILCSKDKNKNKTTLVYENS